MVDVDRRMTGFTPSHLAGLRRLSARAASSPSTPTPSTTILSDAVLSRLRLSGIPVHPGLSNHEFAVLEADYAFTFPPDLRSLLTSGLPFSPGFPDWRHPTSLRSTLRLPRAAVVLLISRHPSVWPRSWGIRPSDPEKAIWVARTALKKAPLLIPIFDRCYIPCNPSLAGNPVFYVDNDRVSCCGSDLADFFNQVGSALLGSESGTDPLPRQRSLGKKRVGLDPGSANLQRRWDVRTGRKPRWVEFWTDIATAVSRMRRNSSSSSTSSSSVSTSSLSLSSPDRYSKNPQRPGTPKWVVEYIVGIGSVLREGGWSEADVVEMVEVSASGVLEGEVVLLDSEAVMDALLMKADRFSDCLRKGGWSSEEVADALGLDFRAGKERRALKELSPGLMKKIVKLAESVCLS